MRAENVLQIMMDFDTRMFWSRKCCLNYLFCVIGNGLKWVNGELNYSCDRADRYILKEDVVRAEPSVSAKLIHEVETEYKTRIRALVGKEYKEFTWYPISERYSYVCNYPKDIKPDWLELILETRNLLIKDGIDIPMYNEYKYDEKGDD